MISTGMVYTKNSYIYFSTKIIVKKLPRQTSRIPIPIPGLIILPSPSPSVTWNKSSEIRLKLKKV